MIKIFLCFPLWASLPDYYITQSYIVLLLLNVPMFLYLFLHSALFFHISILSSFSSAYLFYFWKVLSFLPHPMMHFPDNQSTHSISLTFFNSKFTEKLTMNCRISLLYGLASAKSNVMGMIHVRFEPGGNTA